MSPTLPTELIHRIIDYFPYRPRWLYKLCLVSKSFHSRAHVKLYGTFIMKVEEETRRPQALIDSGEWRIDKSTAARIEVMHENPLLLEPLKSVQISDLQLHEDWTAVIGVPPAVYCDTLLSLWQRLVPSLKLEHLDFPYQPTFLKAASHLRDLKMYISCLDSTTWTYLDKEMHPNLKHLHLKFGRLSSSNAFPARNFSPPSLESFEIHSYDDSIVPFVLLDNSHQSLRRLRLPLSFVPDFELSHFPNLTDLVITKFGEGPPEAFSSEEFLRDLRKLRKLETLSIHGGPNKRYETLLESTLPESALVFALPPSLTIINLPDASIRQVVLFFASAEETSGIKTFGFDVALVEWEEDIRAIDEFCRMKGLNREQYSFELPDWCCKVIELD